MEIISLRTKMIIEKKVLIAAPVHPVLLDALSSLGYECVIREKITQESGFALISDCVGVITSTRLELNKELIDAAPNLQWIGRMGSGMEVIDLGYAGEKGIVCFGSPEGNCNAVAEHAVGMVLDLIRRIGWSQAELQHGIWKREENRGAELEGKTIGIVGYGHTGAAFAKKLTGFDMQILAYDKYAPQRIPPHIINCRDLEPILEEADIVSFHVPAQQDTVGYLNKGFISRMRKPFIVINTSRGNVADTTSLYEGLISGKINGACLDVFEEEPLFVIEKNNHLNRLFTAMSVLPNVIMTPHIAGYTHEALYKMSKILADKVSFHFNNRVI